MSLASLFPHIALLLVVLATSGQASQSKLRVDIDAKDATFRVYLSNSLWFNGGPVSVHNQGKWLSTDDGSLVFGSSATSRGEDAWGSYTSTEVHWMTQDKSYNFYTVTKEYEDEPVLVFEQHFRDGVTDGALDGVKDETMSLFPSLLMEDLDLERGYMTYSGNQLTTTAVGVWGPSTVLPKGDDGGLPLVIFDSELTNTVVISPLSGFMASSQSIFQPASSAKVPAFGVGIMSTVNAIPQDYVYRSVMVAGENVTGTLEKWGKLLRRRYQKNDFARRDDLSVNYLGYWTDNGACYYYTTGQYQDYNEALSQVQKNSSIPFQYLQIDSWWYYKGANGGVKNWTAMPGIFPGSPNSVRNLYKNVNGWPIVAHNRYWSSDTDYAKQNGGDFNFVIDGSYALPNDSKFWHHLLSHAQMEWNLIVYEQDWLDNEFAGLKDLETDLFLGRQWLVDMGEAAAQLGITIQYCMAWPRHLMQTVEIPAVTQIRVSDDYHPGNNQWKIGDASILAHSLGLASFKDTFHTVMVEPLATKCRFLTPEPEPARQTYISALSGGPVGPSDTAGQANATLLMATCMSDGRLLKPTRPALTVDSSFVYRAFKKNGPDGEVYVAYTQVSNWTWYYILGAELNTTFNLTSKELPYSTNGGDVSPPPSSSVAAYAFRYTLSGDIIESKSVVVDKNLPEQLSIQLRPGGDFQYWVIAPRMLPSAYYYLGELSKIITASETRISGVTWSSQAGETLMFLKGAPSESIEVSFTDGKDLFPVRCNFSSTGNAVVHIPDVGNRKGDRPVCTNE